MPAAEQPSTGHADLQALLALGDADFVREAYRAVLLREPDEAGLATYLSWVRAGADKGALVAALARSDEGRMQAVPLAGLAELVAAHTERPRSLAQRIAGRLLAPFRPAPQEPLLRHLRALDNRLYRIEGQLAEQAAAAARLEARLQQALARLPEPPEPAQHRSNPGTPLPRLAPPRAARLLRGLHRALQLRTAPRA
jgi:Domain of unknown function (DUF4214)